jgi:hypothetical protein
MAIPLTEREDSRPNSPYLIAHAMGEGGKIALRANKLFVQITAKCVPFLFLRWIAFCWLMLLMNDADCWWVIGIYIIHTVQPRRNIEFLRRGSISKWCLEILEYFSACWGHWWMTWDWRTDKIWREINKGAIIKKERSNKYVGKGQFQFPLIACNVTRLLLHRHTLIPHPLFSRPFLFSTNPIYRNRCIAF